jgi:trigger factor
VVEVAPDIELKNYKDLSVEQEIYEVGEEDIEATLEEVREKMAVMNPVEDAAQVDHFILADFQEIDTSGIPVIGKKYEDRFFQLSDNESTQELTEQLKGVKAGETRRVKLTTSQDEGGQGQDIKFYNVTVKEVKEKQLPDLNDDLARDFGNFENFEALKIDIRAQLIKQHEATSRRQLQRAIIDEMVKRNTFDIPESMINNYLELLIEDVKKRNNGNVDEQELREHYRANAIWELKWHLIKEKIVEVEHIEVNEEDIKNYINRISAERGIDQRQLWSSLNSAEAKTRLKEDILEEKVLDFLKQHANIKERRITRKDLENAQKLAVPN